MRKTTSIINVFFLLYLTVTLGYIVETSSSEIDLSRYGKSDEARETTAYDIYGSENTGALAPSVTSLKEPICPCHSGKTDSNVTSLSGLKLLYMVAIASVNENVEKLLAFFVSMNHTAQMTNATAFRIQGSDKLEQYIQTVVFIPFKNNNGGNAESLVVFMKSGQTCNAIGLVTPERNTTVKPTLYSVAQNGAVIPIRGLWDCVKCGIYLALITSCLLTCATACGSGWFTSVCLQCLALCTGLAVSLIDNCLRCFGGGGGRAGGQMPMAK